MSVRLYFKIKEKILNRSAVRLLWITIVVDREYLVYLGNRTRDGRLNIIDIIYYCIKNTGLLKVGSAINHCICKNILKFELQIFLPFFRKDFLYPFL